MSNTATTNTRTISIEVIEKGYRRLGPWSSTYEVNIQTLAVNLARKADYLADNGASYPVAEAISALEAAAGDGSIDGFWGTQLQRLTDRAHLAVHSAAERLLSRNEFGTANDIYEMFDGQR